ncbi:PAS domain-containing protein [Eubacteriales bacterium KG127]
MKKRIFLSIVAVALTVLFIAFGISYFVMVNRLGIIQETQLSKQADILATQLNNNGDYQYLEGVDLRDTRVTLIGEDGEVLYDNKEDIKNLRNHATREEVREAAEMGYGKSTRLSKTMTEKYVYAAKRLDDNKIIRVSTSYSTLLGIVEEMAAPMIIMVILVVFLALIVAYRLARDILKPINNVNLDKASSINNLLQDQGYDELSPMFRKIDSQKRDLAQKNRQLDRREAEFESITSNMKDGLVILDDKETVIVINPAALSALGLTLERHYTGKNFVELLRNEEILLAIKETEKCGFSRRVVKLLDKTYQINVSLSNASDDEKRRGRETLRKEVVSLRLL